MSDNNISIDSVIENLISIHPLLTKSFSKSIRTKTNLNPGSLYVLGLLTRHNLLSMSEIGCRLSMPKPHVTGLVDKLILENLVERLNDPHDRRIINIRITEKGIKNFNTIKLEISQEMRLRLEKLDRAKIEVLSIASQQVKDILTEISVENKSESICCKNEII